MKSVKALMFVMALSLTYLAGCTTTTTDVPSTDVRTDVIVDEPAVMEEETIEADDSLMEEEAIEADDSMDDTEDTEEVEGTTDVQ